PGLDPGLDLDPGCSPDSGEGTKARPAPAEILLCGHGRRDRCCGRVGTRLHLDVASTWPRVRVRRCSHTGGHRFAPTGFTFPDGRAWGFLDVPALDRIVRRGGRPGELRGRYRGNTALDQWGQVAERELFERFGWGWLDHEITSSHTEVADGGRLATVKLAWQGPTGAATATASVEVARDVPVLVCGEAPELAEKTSPELVLRSITIHR
ncbi:sucrase ferredoxin, partial [Protofrankia symbiont of Coriaria ruscifolia]|uniref:sucrase ferredoxin n=1 Tax=Protofrankia symbiont of Coriaria ruscifolia TaxID=1306542 RepID=UPI002415888B